MKTNFQDINLKLCVIQELMYTQKLIEPLFDIYKFVESYKERKINIDEEGYEIIPEALDYFKTLEIPTELLTQVTEICQDGGDDIYMQICPFWSGEDEIFNINNIADVSLLPNLKKMTIFYAEDTTILDKLKAKNIEAEFI